MKTRKAFKIAAGALVCTAALWAIWNSPRVIYYRAKRELFATVKSQNQYAEFQTPEAIDALYWSGEIEMTASLLQHEARNIQNSSVPNRAEPLLVLAVIHQNKRL